MISYENYKFCAARAIEKFFFLGNKKVLLSKKQINEKRRRFIACRMFSTWKYLLILREWIVESCMLWPTLKFCSIFGTYIVSNLFYAALPVLLYLNLSRCNLSDDGCEKFSGLLNVNLTSVLE